MAGNSGQTKWKTHLSKDPLLQYICDHSLRLSPAQEKLIKITREHPMNIMLGSADELQLLANLVKLIDGNKTLDVGVYTGYSSLTIAQALPEDGKVVAMDVSEEFVNIGKPIWKEAGVDNKIDLRIAPAKDTLEQLLAGGERETFDFAFIDADKANYSVYYELCIQLVRPGGIIAIDNVIWSGMVADPNVKDLSTESIRDLNKKVKDDPRVDVSMLNIGDGVTLAFKKKSKL